MNLTRVVQLTDGRKLTATIKVKDLVLFERHFNVDAPLASQRLEYWTFLTWSALNRQGDVTEDFDAFLDLIDEFLDADEDIDPKEEAAVNSDEESPAA